MATTLEIIPSATTAPNGGNVHFTPSAATGAGDRVPQSMPASIPADQAYYWSFLWQNGVREAMAALDAGDYEEFDSDDPNDIVRWFLSDD